jgi:NAD(P)-dependent dehydrogenase (short-subunit alcohol dehydrogenase family)
MVAAMPESSPPAAPLFDLAGRVALVTGASRGIGEAIARAFAAAGARVVLASRKRADLEAAAERIREAGGEALALPCHTGRAAEVQALADAVRNAFGGLDVLVNNAGVGVGAAVAEIVTKRLDMQLDVNLRSMVLFYRESLPMLQAAGAEHRNALVVNTSSISGKRGVGWLAVYSATKHGVVGWTEAMNQELGQHGIKSTALCPAFVDTPMTDFAKENVPAEEMIQPQDIAEAVRYLLKVSPACIVPEMMFVRPGDAL